MLRAMTWLIGLLVFAAVPAVADNYDAEAEVVYEDGAYTVYREKPAYCALYFDFANNGMARFSYSGSNGDIYFSVVKDNFPDLPDENLPVTFAFDDSNVWFSYLGVPYDLAKVFEGETRRGLSMGGDTRLLNGWAASRKVAIRFGVFGAHPTEDLDITGADKAVAALKACAKS